ncbi:MAG: hypothetical protein LBT00_00115, partial [Spirochaetaceae bacterium]|nr:hypothetical protein [Spirochaetaceae bacterium]
MTRRGLSLRAAKRQSNPDGEGLHPGLLRSARNDGRLARNDAAGVVIASREAAKQSRWGRPSPWIA